MRPLPENYPAASAPAGGRGCFPLIVVTIGELGGHVSAGHRPYSGAGGGGDCIGVSNEHDRYREKEADAAGAASGPRTVIP